MKHSFIILFLSLAMMSAKCQHPSVTASTTTKKPDSSLPTTQIVVDASEIGTGLNQFSYTGTWQTNWTKPDIEPTTFSWSTTENSEVTQKFYGTKIEVVGETWPSHGITAFSIDGGPESFYDQYSDPGATFVTLFTSPTLSLGEHTLKIRATGTANVSSSNVYSLFFQTRITTVVTPPDPEQPIAADYVVSQAHPSASDAGPCDANQPCATINAAAQRAQAGDVVLIRAGTYHETIIPANNGSNGSPILFKGAPGESVIITGLETIPNTGWTAHSGNIYKKTITLPVNGFAPGGVTSNTTILANQIFRNGEMQIQARWPNGVKNQNDLWKMDATGTVSTSGWRHYSNFSGGATTWPNIPMRPTWLRDNLLPSTFTAGSLVGATVLIQGWYIMSSKTVTGHAADGTLSWSGGVWGDNANDQQFRRYYHLTNQLQFLDQEREFHYEGNTLYYYQPGGGTPTGTIEYKARNWGFDLRTRSYITIQGLTFIGCEPATGNTSTAFCTIDNIRASYMNHNYAHNVSAWQGHGIMKEVGTKLIGVNNTVKNSEFQWSASQAVWLGNNGLAQNNLFHHIGYDGMWGCPVAFWGNDGINNIKVLNNTAYTLGRGFVDNGTTRSESGGGGHIVSSTNHEIAYNNVYDYCKLNHDGGAWYSAGFCNLAGLRIHHNWFHDFVSFRPPNGTLTDGIMAAIYFDMGSGAAVGQAPVTVDHNIFWGDNVGGYAGTEYSDVYELPSFQASTKQPTRYYNNVFWGDIKSFTTYQNAANAIARNNIIRKSWNNNWGAAGVNIANSISAVAQHGMAATNPLFTGGSLSTPQTYFTLQAGSPARNNGTSVSPYNNDDTAPKDIGAYYYGQPTWVPGYVPVTDDSGGESGAGNIATLATVANITVPYNTAFGTNGATVGLPAAINCTFDDSSTGTVPMTWAIGSYNPLGTSGSGFRVSTEYTIVGTPVTGGGITNTNSVIRSVTVTVQHALAPVSGIAGFWDFTGLVTSTANDYGTVDGSNNITLVKSLAPGPVGRDFNALNTAPKLSAGTAAMIGTGAFKQVSAVSDLYFLHYKPVTNDLKWTAIFVGNLTDTNTANGAIIGNNGINTFATGMVLNYSSNTSDNNLTTLITAGGGNTVAGATHVNAIVPGTQHVYTVTLDNSLTNVEKSKVWRGNTLITATASGSAAPSNATPGSVFNLGDGGTFSSNDASGNYKLFLILEGVPSDAILNKLKSDIAAYTGTSL